MKNGRANTNSRTSSTQYGLVTLCHLWNVGFKLLGLTIVAMVLTGCGTKGDSADEDNRVCFVQNVCNNELGHEPIDDEANSNDIEVETIGECSVTACGLNTKIEDVIANISGETPNLSEFLSTGRRLDND